MDDYQSIWDYPSVFWPGDSFGRWCVWGAGKVNYAHRFSSHSRARRFCRIHPGTVLTRYYRKDWLKRGNW